jgi:hypothetical protein
LTTYAKYKNQAIHISVEQAQQLDQIDTGPGKEDSDAAN